MHHIFALYYRIPPPPTTCFHRLHPMITMLETARAAIEEIEEIEAAILNRLQRNPQLHTPAVYASSVLLRHAKKRSYKETLLQQHEVSLFLSQYAKQAAIVQEILRETRHLVLDPELVSLTDPAHSLKAFDEAIAGIKQHHERYPNLQTEDLAHLYSMGSSGLVMVSETDEAGLKALTKRKKPKVSLLSAFGSSLDLDLMFTSEELLGKYVDLNECHKLYLNLSGLPKVPYLEYLDCFNRFSKPFTPKDQLYVAYLRTLNGYLKGFYAKAYPLEDLGALLKTLNAAFDTQTRNTTTTGAPESADGSVWCEACGRNFAKRTVYDGHLGGKRHLKAVSQTVSMSASVGPSSEVLRLEFEIAGLAEALGPIIVSTKQNTTRRRALTDRERALEIMTLTETLDDDESDCDASEKEGSENPNHLPLGFDGKPMPFWLYKLQGLSKAFRCEVCCNETYMGRKLFVAHFLEPKHIHGLRCLGIEPSAAFKGITGVSEATKLWDTLKKEKRREEAEREGAVEVEDQEGNVIEERVYEDLKRQGLL